MEILQAKAKFDCRLPLPRVPLVCPDNFGLLVTAIYYCKDFGKLKAENEAKLAKMDENSEANKRMNKELGIIKKVVELRANMLETITAQHGKK